MLFFFGVIKKKQETKQKAKHSHTDSTIFIVLSIILFATFSTAILGFKQTL